MPLPNRAAAAGWGCGNVGNPGPESETRMQRKKGLPTAFHALRAAANAKQPDAPNVQKTGTQAAFPGGVRFSDYLGLGVIAQVFPLGSIEAALGACGVRSVRRRDLPLEAMAHYL